jgi:hypothetical protein
MEIGAKKYFFIFLGELGNWEYFFKTAKAESVACPQKINPG